MSEITEQWKREAQEKLREARRARGIPEHGNPPGTVGFGRERELLDRKTLRRWVDELVRMPDTRRRAS